MLKRFLKKSASASESEMKIKLREFSAYTMGNLEGLKTHYYLGQLIRERNIEGDIVECGVYNGGSSATLAWSAGCLGRKIWLYDSFEGMPSTTAADGEDAKKYVGECVGSIDKVKEVMSKAGVTPEGYVIRKGWFNETFREAGSEKIAVLHIDSDWYDSVYSCLDRFYSKVVEGGIILLDDFGHWEGCRRAFFDFCSKHNLYPLVERRGHTQLFWIKTKEHNREFSGKGMPHESIVL